MNNIKHLLTRNWQKKLFDNLSNALPQRAWFVFVYDQVTGYEYHGYWGKVGTDVIEKWRENDKMLSVVSFDVDEYPEFSNSNDVMDRFEYVQYLINRCIAWIPGAPPEKRAGKVYLHYLTANETQTGLLTYGVRSDLNLAFEGTEERFIHLNFNVSMKCRQRWYFLFDVFSIG
jgi:hypothetical protein